MFSFTTVLKFRTKTQYNTKMTSNAKKSLRLLFLPAFVIGAGCTFFAGHVGFLVVAAASVVITMTTSLDRGMVIVLLGWAGCLCAKSLVEDTFPSADVSIEMQFVGELQVRHRFSSGVIVDLKGNWFAEQIPDELLTIHVQAFADSSLGTVLYESSHVIATVVLRFKDNSLRASISEFFVLQQRNCVRAQGRNWVLDNIRNGIPESLVGIVYAVITGDRSLVPDKQTELFAKTGTLHLLAVSGLHTGILCAILWNVLGFLPRARPWVVVSLMFAFAWFTNTPSCWRASSMFAVWLLSKQFGRLSDSLALFSTAIVAICVVNPQACLAPGFHLSVLAVGSLLYVVPGVQAIVQKRHWNIRALVIGSTVSWSASSFVGLYLALGGTPIHACSLAINIVVVPVFSFGVACAYVGALLPIQALSAVYFEATAASLECALQLLRLLFDSHLVHWDNEATLIAVIGIVLLWPLVKAKDLKGVVVWTIAAFGIQLGVAVWLVPQVATKPGFEYRSPRQHVVYESQNEILMITGPEEQRRSRSFGEARQTVSKLAESLRLPSSLDRDSLQLLVADTEKDLVKLTRKLRWNGCLLLTANELGWQSWNALDWLRANRPHVEIRRLHTKREPCSVVEHVQQARQNGIQQRK